MNGPKVWKRLFEAVLPIYGSAIIAGGSPRDYAVNKRLKPKDIDVFVPIESEFDLELSLFELKSSDIRSCVLIDPERHGYSFDVLAASNVRGVIEGFMEVPINIIGKRPEAIADIDTLIRDFDHSLCQFWVTPDDVETVHRTAEADRSLATRSITTYNVDGNVTPTAGTNTDKRLQRLIGRKQYADMSYGRPEKKSFKSTAYSTQAIDWAEILNRRPNLRANVNHALNIR